MELQQSEHPHEPLEAHHPKFSPTPKEERQERLGGKIEKLRKEKNLSQIQLAEKAGVHPIKIIYLEGGHSLSLEIRVEELLSIANALDHNLVINPSPPYDSTTRYRHLVTYATVYEKNHPDSRLSFELVPIAN